MPKISPLSVWLARLVRSRKLADAPDYGSWWNLAASDRAGAYATTYVADNEADYRSRGWNGDANSFGARQFIEMARLDEHSRVLEIGCGAARVGREMAPHVAEWHGADISENMLAHARQRTVGQKNIHYHLLTSVSLGEFQYLLESRRVLRPKGYAFFDTWNLLHPDTYRQWRGIQRDNTGMGKSRGRIQFCTAAELRCYLDDAGFEIVRLDEDKLLRVFCRKRASNVHEHDDGLAPFGYVDEPRNELLLERSLSVRGWVLDDVRSVEVRADGELSLGHATLGDPRPDVAAVFPRYPAAAACGYHLDAPCDRLSPGHHTLQVLATDGSGHQTDLAGNYLGFSIQG